MRVVFCILLCIVVNCYSHHHTTSGSDSRENEISQSEEDVSSHHHAGETSEEKDDKLRHVKMDMKIKHGSKKAKPTPKQTKQKQYKRKNDIDEERDEYYDDEKYLKIPPISGAENKHTNDKNMLSCPNSKTLRAKSKQTSTTHSYPFVVSVLRKGSHYASGALLDDKWVLTCAGEFYNVRESIKLMRVRLGSVDNKHGGMIVPLKGIVLHPFFVNGEPSFDLAMLRLAMPIRYNEFIKPICITTLKSKVIGGKFLTMYWPRLIVKNEPLPSTASERVRHTSLRVSTQKMITPEICHQQLHSTNITFDISTLCLKPFSKHHTRCVPDAGAPVIGEDGLWGIVSGWTSPECLQKPSPYMFTRLSSDQVQSWLDKHLTDKHS